MVGWSSTGGDTRAGLFGARAASRNYSAPAPRCACSSHPGSRTRARSRGKALVWEAVGPDEAHEVRAGQHTHADRRAFALGEEDHVLVPSASDGLHEPAAFDEL